MKRVLVVDDNEKIRTLIRRMLKRLPVQVKEAEDGEQALFLHEHETYDLIVTDLVLPGMSGIDLSRAIQERRPGTRTLLVSGYDNGLLGPEERDIPFLQKPFDRSALLSAVSEVLAGDA